MIAHHQNNENLLQTEKEAFKKRWNEEKRKLEANILQLEHDNKSYERDMTDAQVSCTACNS